jgi:hypothetical protein
LFNFGNLQACRINSLRSDDTFMTRHFAGKVRTSLGRKYRVLIETGPDIATEWGVSAGIQTAMRANWDFNLSVMTNLP